MTEADNGRESWGDEPFAPIESLLRAAENFVQPSDDLRPKTLESAREQRSQQKINRRIGGMAVAVILLATLGLPDFLTPSPARKSDSSPFVATAYDMHQRAARLAADTHVDPSWALLEAFVELRHSQAKLFSNSL